MISVELPWPPSVNNYWRHTSRGHYISPEGKKFKRAVQIMLSNYRPSESRISVLIEAYPPDRRGRDLDNIQKALLDSMQGLLFRDDSQIDDLRIVRREVVKHGRVVVHLEALKG